MSVIHVPRRQLAQPQGRVELDRGHALAQGLILAREHAQTIRDLASGKAVSQPNRVLVPTQSGIALGMNGSSQHEAHSDRTLSAAFGAMTWTFLYMSTGSAIQTLCGVLNTGLTTAFSVALNAVNDTNTSGRISTFLRQEGGVLNGYTSDAALPCSDGGVHCLSVTVKAGSADQIFFDGNRVASSRTSGSGATLSTFVPLGFDMTIGARNVRGTLDRRLNGGIVLTFAHAGVLLDEQIGEIHTAPWQLFRADPIRIYSLPSGGTNFDLTIASLLHAHTAENLTLQFDGALAVAGMGHTHTLESLTLSADLGLAVADASHAHTAEAVTLSADAQLGVADAAHGHALDAVTLSADMELAAEDMGHTHTVESATLSADLGLLVADHSYAHTVEAVTLADESGGTPWTPAAISTEVWFDAADAATLTLDGAAVTQWADKSGNARHGEQSSASLKPAISTAALNGLDVISFDQDYLSLVSDVSSVSEATVLVVLKTSVDPAPADHTSGLWGFGTGVTTHYPYIDGVIYESFGTTSRKTVGDPTQALSAPRIYGIESASGHWSAFLDGAPIFSTTTNTVGWMAGQTLGKSSTNHFLVGQIAELVIIPTVAVDGRQKIEGYLAHKWALEANLPSDHPYKAAPPTLSGTTSLSIGDQAHTHTLEAVTLSAALTLSVQDQGHGHSLDAVALSAALNLIIDEALHAHTLEAVELDASNSSALAPAELVHTHTLDALTLSAALALLVDDASHAHTAENVALSSDHDLVVAASAHAHTLEAPDLFSGIALAIQDAFHAHPMTAAQLTADLGLIIDSVIHGHTLDNAAIFIPLAASDLLRRSVFARIERMSYVVRVEPDSAVVRVESDTAFTRH